MLSEGDQVINRFDANEWKLYDTKKRYLHIRDTSLVQYVGKWISEDLIIYLDSIVSVDLHKKRKVTADALTGRLNISIDDQDEAYTIGAVSAGRQILSIHSDEYWIYGDAVLDSADHNTLNWYKAGVLRKAWLIRVSDTTDINGKRLVEAYKKLPNHIVLTRTNKE